MQRLEVSGAVRLIYKSLGVKGLNAKCKIRNKPWASFVRTCMLQHTAAGCTMPGYVTAPSADVKASSQRPPALRNDLFQARMK